MPRALMCFQQYDGWNCSFIEADCRTSNIDLPLFEALRAFVIRCNPEDINDFDYCIRTWNKGSVWVSLTDEQYAKLRRRTRGNGAARSE
jgi:hypothetical protein